MQLLELNTADVHLWLTFVDEIADPALLNRYHKLLSSDERQRYSRFRSAADQHRYLVTRALVRTVLSRYAGIQPDEWKFAKNAYDKPIIANPDPASRSLSFNLSHTQGLVLLGVTSENAIGVDVEKLAANDRVLNVAENFFAPDEVDDLRALPRERQPDRFFSYWTLKESYVKARGMGMSISLNEFSFRFLNETTFTLTTNVRSDARSHPWQFWQFMPSPDYVAAICVEHTRDLVPRISLKKTIPLQSEESIEFASLRTSV